MSSEHVILIRPGALGDAVLTLPVVAALRNAGKKVSIVGTPSSWAFLAQNTHGVRVSDFGGHEWLCLFDETRKPSDVSLKELSSALAIVYLASGGEQVAARLRSLGVKTTRVVPPPLANEPTPTQEPMHASVRLLEALKGLFDTAIASVDIQNVLETKSHEFSKRVHDFEFFTKPYAVIHPGSGGQKKCWPAERYAELAAGIAAANVLPVALFGPADDAIYQRFENALPPDLNAARVQNEKLRNVLALLQGARGYAGNDSGVTHLAAQICPTTALFGPTDPAVWAPVGDEVKVLRAGDGSLDSIPVQEVLENVLR